MKQKHGKKIFIAFLCTALLATLAALALLSSCREDVPPEDTPDPAEGIVLAENGTTGYVIVRPDLTDKAVTNAAMLLRRAINAVGDIEIEIFTDYEPAADYEILIGNTERAESKTAMAHLGDDSFRIEIINDKVTIVGQDNAMTAMGVRYFVREVLGYRSAYDFEKRQRVSLAADFGYSEVVSMTAEDPRNPADILIYSCTVLEYGAAGDGATDDTKAFQSALDAVNKAGGGTVYVPAGQYRIDGSLTVGRSTYLAGAWVNPETDPDKMHDGTILLATGNKGKSDNAKALITVGASAGVMGLTVYYPEQSVDAPVTYPPTIRIRDGIAGDGSQHAASVQNVTLIGSYTGVAADEGLQLPTMRDVYITALSRGFSINGCYDCARITTMHISPAYWATYTGMDASKIAAATKRTATGMIIKRTDAQMMTDLVVESCAVGISLERDTTNSGETAGGSSIAGLVIRDCTVGIVDEYNSCSISDATISCSGVGALCVRVSDKTAETSALRFYDCTFENGNGPCVAIENGTAGQLSIQNCTFLAWNGGEYALNAEGGVLMVSNTAFEGTGKAVYLGKNVSAATVTSNAYAAGVTAKVTSDADDARVLAENVSASVTKPTAFALSLPTPPVVAATKQVFNVKDYGAKADGKTDDTQAFSKAVKAAKEAGGGIVYVPAGYYNVKQGLDIPTGVELRGVSECMHVSSGEGSVLYVTEGQGEEDEVAFLTMEHGSGVRGLTFWYPEQAWNDVRAYPYTIRVMGKDCSIRNICLGNTYQGIDMATADCGGHYVENITGCVMKNGIALDGSTKAGVILNTHFNVTFYYNVGSHAKLSDQSGDFSYNMVTPMMNYLNQNMTAYRFGTAVDETLLFVFNYRARYGMEFTGGFDGTIIGCGVDGSLCGVKITGSYEKELSLLSFSDDIVPGQTAEGNLGIYVNVDDDSTVRFVAGSASSYNYVPSGLVVLEKGNLILEGFNAHVTPASGDGAIRVKNGHASVSGLYLPHVGPLDKAGAFTQQPNSSNTVDVRVDKNGSLTLYSAIGARFFRDKIDGDVDTLNVIVTK